jgi:hypothetical protein
MTRTVITTAATAIIQGSGRVPPPFGRPAPRVPVGVPQAWQKRAPGDNGASHLAQADWVSGAPQWVQNLPDAGLPQLGQVVFDALSVISFSAGFGSA